jgi:hypothetical protein
VKGEGAPGLWAFPSPSVRVPDVFAVLYTVSCRAADEGIMLSSSAPQVLLSAPRVSLLTRLWEKIRAQTKDTQTSDFRLQT